MKPDGNTIKVSETTSDAIAVANSLPFICPSASHDNFCCDCPDSAMSGYAQNSNRRGKKASLLQTDMSGEVRGNQNADGCNGNVPKAEGPPGALHGRSWRTPCRRLPGDINRDRQHGHVGQQRKDIWYTKSTRSVRKGFPGKDMFLFWANKVEGDHNKTISRTVVFPKPLEKPQQDGESLSEDSQQEVDNGLGRCAAVPDNPETIQKRTRRELLRDLDIFSELDVHVLHVGEKLKATEQPPLSVQTVVPLITQLARSPLEKVRAIWMWLCHNIKYDVDGFLGLSEKIHQPEQVLQTKRGVCSGYAHLCHEMCKEVGVTCVEVSGYGRSAGSHHGQTFLQKKSNHMWNAVRLEAQWFLLDACWGAGLVDVEKKLFIPRYEDFFFLTDPEHFIETHWPDEPSWQLLQPPLSLADLEERAFKTPEFFKLQLCLISPDTSVLRTAQGEAAVTVEGALSAEFTYQLLKLGCDGSKEDIGGAHGMLMLLGKRMVLKVFPPAQGLYDLQIFARLSGSPTPCVWVCSQQIECLQCNGREELPPNPFSFWGLHPQAKEFGIEGCNWEEALTVATNGSLKLVLQTKWPLLVTYELVHRDLEDLLSKKCLLSQVEEETLTCHVRCPFVGYHRLSVFVKRMGEKDFQNVVNFLIDCCSPVNQNELFPVGLSPHCGTGMSSQQWGLSNPSHTNPIINTKQGRCNITFHTQPGLEITATLSKDHIGNKRYPMERYTFITHLEDKVSICVLLPESGIYRVGLYGKCADGTEFTHVCDYVIRCFNNPQWPPFPKMYSLWRRGCVLLRPRTGVLPAQSWERFRLKMPKACSALVMGNGRTELRQEPNKVWEGDVYTGPAGTTLKVAVKFSWEAPSMEVVLSFDVEGSSTPPGDSSG